MYRVGRRFYENTKAHTHEHFSRHYINTFSESSQVWKVLICAYKNTIFYLLYYLVWIYKWIYWVLKFFFFSLQYTLVIDTLYAVTDFLIFNTIILYYMINYFKSYVISTYYRFSTWSYKKYNVNVKICFVLKVQFKSNSTCFNKGALNLFHEIYT